MRCSDSNLRRSRARSFSEVQAGSRGRRQACDSAILNSLSWVRIWAFAEIASRALSRPSAVRPPTYDLRDACGRAVSLPAVDAYAQSRRLQPVLRASETAAPPAPPGIVPKAPPAWVLSVLSHSPQRHREKPGIEEQHNTLRLARTTHNRGQKSEVRRKSKPGSGLRFLRFQSSMFRTARHDVPSIFAVDECKCWPRKSYCRLASSKIADSQACPRFLESSRDDDHS